MSFVQRCQSLKEATQLSLDEIEGFDQISERVLTQVVLECIRTYQKKVAVGIEDSASDLLDTFKKNVTKQIFDTAAGWRVTQRDHFLFPRGCRFCFQKGDNTIVVIEQDPQVRTLSFAAGMLDVDQEPVNTDEAQRAFLSLPYTIFVFAFTNEKFSRVKCFWRTAPLMSLNDNVFSCVLPNIHVGGDVCLGFNPNSRVTNYSEVCESTITSFWSSRFNGDLAAEWWSKSVLSSLISTGTAWEYNTRENPLFILSVPFRLHKSLKEVVDSMANSEQISESVFRHRVSTDVDSCVSQLFHKITAYMKKTKFDKYYPKDVQEPLRKHLRSSVSELVDVVMSLHHEIGEVSEWANAVQSARLDKEMLAAGILWDDS
jgi:hypothetical protein